MVSLHNQIPVLNMEAFVCALVTGYNQFNPFLLKLTFSLGDANMLRHLLLEFISVGKHIISKHCWLHMALQSVRLRQPSPMGHVGSVNMFIHVA